MESAPPADSTTDPTVGFHDVVLSDGRSAAVELTGTDVVIGTYRMRRWVVPVLAVATALHVVLVVNTAFVGTPPFAPLYLFLFLAVPLMRTRDVVRRPLAGIRAIDVDEKRITIRTVDETLVLLPKSWQRERLLGLLRSRAPHVHEHQGQSEGEAIAVAEGPRDVHALEDDIIGWVPFGHTPAYTLAGAGALTAGIVLAVWSRLDPSFPAFTMDIAWTAAALALVLWAMDQSAWYWLRRSLDRASGAGDPPLTLGLRRRLSASRLRGWTSVTAEPTPRGLALVERHMDLFDFVVVCGIACVASTALLGGPNILAAGVAYALLSISGYPRKRYAVEEILSVDVLEFEDERGRGVLRIRASDAAREYGIRYQIRTRDRVLALLREVAPDARIHEPVRVHGVGSSGKQSVDLRTVHDRLVELGEREETAVRREGITPDG